MMTLSITRSSISTKKDSYKESKFINWVKACQKDSEEWGQGIIDDQEKSIILNKSSKFGLVFVFG